LTLEKETKMRTGIETACRSTASLKITSCRCALSKELFKTRRTSVLIGHANELNRKLAGAIDLEEAVANLSVWLEGTVAHDLVGVSVVGGRHQIRHSTHGPRRALIEAMATSLLADAPQEDFPRTSLPSGWACLVRASGRGSDCVRIVVLREDKPFHGSESRAVTTALEALAACTGRLLRYEEILRQAHRDSLTGLASRRALDERLGPMVETAARHARPVTLAVMDLDRFKQVNDYFGHAEGDAVLKRVASTLSGLVRSSDLLARIGGDEFVLVMPDTGAEAAARLIERLREAVDDLRVITPAGRLGVSLGLIGWRAGLSMDAWFREADDALYRDKTARRSLCMHAAPPAGSDLTGASTWHISNDCILEEPKKGQWHIT
jgi:diguanylate cyclase (GGDEF)-like protein